MEVLLDPGMIFGTGADAQICMEELSARDSGGRGPGHGSGSGIFHYGAALAQHATSVDAMTRRPKTSRGRTPPSTSRTDRFTA